MSTSLTRQLTQLRAASGAAAASLSAHTADALLAATPALLHPDQHKLLDGHSFPGLAAEAFAHLVELRPELGPFAGQLGVQKEKAGTDQKQEVAQGGQEEGGESWQEHVLLLLSPYALRPQAQIVLQWMLFKHSVHDTHAELFLLSLLPWYEHVVFARAVEAVDKAGRPPKWLAAFKGACFPATSIGMRRHVASDRGFFGLLCDYVCVRLTRHVGRFGDGADGGINSHWTYFYCSTVLAALGNSGDVGELRMHGLMRVVIAGLRSPYEELFALGATMLARVFPRVQLREKVVKKVLRVLDDISKKVKDVKAMTLVLIVLRSQKSNVDCQRVLNILLPGYEAVLEQTLARGAEAAIGGPEATGDADFARRVLACLALLAEHVATTVTSSPPYDSHTSLFRLLNCGLERGCTFDRATAVALIRYVSGTLVAWKAAKKKAKKRSKNDDSKATEDMEACTSGISLCRKILGHLRQLFPLEYAEHSSVHMSEVDIMFLGGVDDKEGPSAEEIAAKRVLMNNELVTKATSELLPASKRERGLKRLRRDQLSVMKSLFSDASTDFLLQQVAGGPSKSVWLAANCLTIFDLKSAVAAPVVKFLCSHEVDEAGGSTLLGEGADLALAVLAHIAVVPEGKSWPAAQSAVVGSALAKRSRVLAATASAIVNQPNCPGSLIDQLVKKVAVEDVVSMALSVNKHPYNRQPTAATILLHLLSASLEKARVKGSDGDYTNIAEAIIMLVETAFKYMEIHVNDNKQENEENKEIKRKKKTPLNDEEKDLGKLLLLSRKLRVVPLITMLTALNCLKRKLTPKLVNNENFALAVLKLAAATRKKHPRLFEAIEEVLDELKMDQVFSARVMVDSSLPLPARLLAATRLSKWTTDAAASDRQAALMHTSPISASLLATVCGGGRASRRAASILATLTAKVKVSKDSVAPLAQRLVEQIEAIVSSPDNLATIAEDYVRKDLSGRAALQSLLAGLVQREDMENFRRLEPLLTALHDEASASLAASFGSKLLSSESTAMADGTFAVLLRVFVGLIGSHLEDEECSKFLSKCLRSQELVYQDRERAPEQMGVLALRGLRWPQPLEGKAATRLFRLLVDLAGDDAGSGGNLYEARAVVQSLRLTTVDYTTLLADLWGQGMTGLGSSAATKRRQSRRQSTLTSSDDLTTTSESSQRVWPKTIFALELLLPAVDGMSDTGSLLRPLFSLLDKCCGADAADGSEAASPYALDLVLSCALATVNKTSDDNVRRSLPNAAPELLVRCLSLSRADAASRSTALLTLARVCEAGADGQAAVQHTVPIFTFVGSHLLRVDSRHSFDIACRAIDVIVPRLVASSSSTGNAARQASLDVVAAFAAAALDMPAHRLRSFLKRLVRVLGEKDHLWILCLLLLQSVGKKRAFLESGGEEKVVRAVKLQQVLDVCSSFTAFVQADCLVRMLVNLRPGSASLQRDSPDLRLLLRGKKVSAEEAAVEVASLRSRALVFATNLLSSAEFRSTVAAALMEGEEGAEELQRRLELIAACAIEMAREASEEGKRLALLAERTLEATLAVLPPPAFTSTLAQLLCSNKSAVRRRALEALAAKLAQDGGSSDLMRAGGDAVAGLLKPLVALATGVVDKSRENDIQDDAEIEGETNQQLAMVTLRSFGKVLGGEFPAELGEACATLCSKSFLSALLGDKPGVAASALFALPDLLAAAGPRAAVPLLPRLASWQLTALDKAIQPDSPAVLISAAILSAQRLLESFAGFLHPYFKDFLSAACKMSSLANSEDHSKKNIDQRVRHLQSSIARLIPVHALLPAMPAVAEEAAAAGPEAVSALAYIASEVAITLNKTRASAVAQFFVDFFVGALRYRQTALDKQVEASESAIEAAELDMISSFLTFSLKLPLEDFKPVFYRIFNAPVELEKNPTAATTTIFNVAAATAHKLRSLFDFALDSLAQKAMAVLSDYSKDRFAKLLEDGPAGVATVEAALSALTAGLEHTRGLGSAGGSSADGSGEDNGPQLSGKAYEELVDALLALFEIEKADGQEQHIRAKLVACLDHLAVATMDDTDWKYLHYQSLLCLRSDHRQVRSSVLDLLMLYVERKGESYLASLPEAAPFLAEVVEDEDPDLEAKCRAGLTRMEQIFGHSVQSYFE